MIRRLVQSLWALLCLLLALSFAGREAHAFDPQYRAGFVSQLAFIESKHVPYGRGGASLKFVDCTGYLFLAAKWAGIPGITRTTAEKMAQGLGGWDSQKIDKDWAKAGDLAFWIFGSTHHAGAFAGGPDVYHASWGKQQVVRAPFKWMDKNFSQARELTIGD